MTPIKNRYEFVYYLACTNGNPNGDPDMGNVDRIHHGCGDKAQDQKLCSDSAR